MMYNPATSKQKAAEETINLQLREMEGVGKIKLGVCVREMRLNRDYIDEDARTVQLSFSSETPYERWYGNEILGHNASEVRLGRMKDGAPLLFNHNPDNHIGVVEDVKLENNRGQAVVRFGNSALANEKFQDVKDGILKKVSVGYLVHKAVLVEQNKDGLDTYRMTDWEPLENSLVTVPADNTVGVGRNDDAFVNLCREFESFETTVDVSIRKAEPEPTTKIEPTLIKETKMTPQEIEEAATKAVKERGDAEAARIREIGALGNYHSAKIPGFAEKATVAIQDGTSVESFQRTLLDEMQKAPASSLQPATRIGLTAGEVQNFSMIRAINAAISGNWSKAGFEHECSLAIAEKLGREARGFYVPFEVQNRANMTAGGAATGAELVGTEHMAGSFIENLRATALAGQLGAIILPGLVGNVDIPTKTSSAAFAFVAEDTTSGDAALATGTLSLSPKILAGGVAMSRTLLKQSAPEVEQMVMNDLVKGAALGVDLAAFRGTGAANNPTGIVTTSGVPTSTIVAPGTPTFVELVEFETDVNAGNGLSGSLAYVTTPAVLGNMKTTTKDSGSGRFLYENGEANGYQVRTSTQLTANDIIFGNFNEVIIAMWGVLDILPDTATNAVSGGLVLRAFQDCDIGIRHAASFCINA